MDGKKKSAPEGPIFLSLVELPGSRPPGPKSRTAAFSRLSTDFILSASASRYRNQPRSSPG